MNYKGMLQDFLIKERLPPVTYTSSKHGSEHDPQFSATACVGDTAYPSKGHHSTKRSAEQDAARFALEYLQANRVSISKALARVNDDVRPTMVLLDGENVPFSTLLGIAPLRRGDVGVWNFVQAAHPQQNNRGEFRPLRTVLVNSTASDAVDVAIVVQASIFAQQGACSKIIVVTGDKIGIGAVEVLQQTFASGDVQFAYAANAAHCATLFN